MKKAFAAVAILLSVGMVFCIMFALNTKSETDFGEFNSENIGEDQPLESGSITPVAVPEPNENSGISVDAENFTVRFVKPKTVKSDFLKLFKNEVALPELSDTDYVATASILKCKSNAYKVILAGDCDGNGIVNSTDYLMCKRAVLDTYTLSALRYSACDVNCKDGVNATDYLMLKRAVLGTFTIT